MHTTRRTFFGLMASAVAAGATVTTANSGEWPEIPEGSPHAPLTYASTPVIRPQTDCDLSVTTLLMAMGRVGPGPYLLRVHDESLGHARSVLCHAFSGGDWRRDFTITRNACADVDEWSLQGRERAFYTQGA